MNSGEDIKNRMKSEHADESVTNGVTQCTPLDDSTGIN